MALAVACMVAANAGAHEPDTYNDSVRTNTWTLTVGGGISGATNMRNVANVSRHRVGPEGFIGVKYNITPMWRLGLNMGYLYNRRFVGEVAHFSYTTDYTFPETANNREVTTDKTVNAARLDNGWTSHQLYGELAINWNILDLWHHRKAQQWNLWLGAGVGYLYTHYNNGQIWAVDEEAVAQGDGYFNVYNHPYLAADGIKHNLNSIYVPVSLSLEYDITPRWTVGAYGHVKFMTQKQDYMPRNIWGAGLSVSYNFVGKRFPSDKKKLQEALARYDELENTCALRATECANALQDEANKNKKLADEYNKKLAEKEAELAALKNGHVVFFPIDKDYLTDQEKLRLDDYISKVKGKSDVKLSVVGEASSDGITEKNQTLSEGRLSTVLNYLKSNGISEASVKDQKAIGDTKAEPNAHYRRVTIIAE